MIDKRIGVALFAATLAWLPAQPAYAIFHWCRGCGTPATAMYAPTTVGYAPYSVGYAPYVAAYAPAPCGSACVAPCATACAAPCVQTVSYVPQTSYRTVYYSQPVVAYSPVAACGACGPTTVMRPVTTYVTAARLVPYTSYRPVVAGYAPSPCGMGGCGVAAPQVAAAAYYAPVAPAAPACCGANYAAPVGAGYAPSMTTGYAPPTPAPMGYAPAPVPAAVPAPQVAPIGTPGGAIQSPPPGSAYPSQGQTPSLAPQQGQPQPSDQSPSQGQPSQTFDNPNDQSAPEPQSRIVLPPRSANSTSTGVPRALDPEDALDQSTAIPLRRSVAMRPVSTAVAPQATTTDAGWRSARKQ